MTTSAAQCGLETLLARIDACIERRRLGAHVLPPMQIKAVDVDAPARDIWAGLAAHGRPIQYAHVPAPLALWDVWTPFAAMPVAFEPPSAGFVLDWASIRAIQRRGVAFATLTLAAGISSNIRNQLNFLLRI